MAHGEGIGWEWNWVHGIPTCWASVDLLSGIGGQYVLM